MPTLCRHEHTAERRVSVRDAETGYREDADVVRCRDCGLELTAEDFAAEMAAEGVDLCRTA